MSLIPEFNPGFIIPPSKDQEARAKLTLKGLQKLAKSKDIIVLAGKGHETYQEISGNKIPFNDKNELKKAFKII